MNSRGYRSILMGTSSPQQAQLYSSKRGLPGLLVLTGVVSHRYIIVVEHDLSVLDYLSDFICCLYGVPSAYGVVTMPFSVREGSYMASSHASITHFFLFFPICVFSKYLAS